MCTSSIQTVKLGDLPSSLCMSDTISYDNLQLAGFITWNQHLETLITPALDILPLGGSSCFHNLVRQSKGLDQPRKFYEGWARSSPTLTTLPI